MASVALSGGEHFFVTSSLRFFTKIWWLPLSRTANRFLATNTADAPAPLRLSLDPSPPTLPFGKTCSSYVPLSTSLLMSTAFSAGL